MLIIEFYDPGRLFCPTRTSAEPLSQYTYISMYDTGSGNVSSGVSMRFVLLKKNLEFTHPYRFPIPTDMMTM